MKFNRHVFRDWAISLIKTFLRGIYSAGRIGIAPLTTLTYAEDSQASKMQLQVFSVALSRLRHALSDADAVQRISFYILPGHIRVANEQDAALLGRLFGCDALLWGSYIAPGEEDVWLNIFRSHRKRVSGGGLHGLHFQRSLFPNSVDIDAHYVCISQYNDEDAYITLAIVLIQVLQQRAELRRQQRLTRYYDSLFLESQDTTKSLLFNLVLETAQQLPNTPLESGKTSASSLLAHTAGLWVGNQMAGEIFRDNKDIWLHSREKFAKVLYGISSKLSTLLPDQSEHYYRCGALACILNDKVGAIRHFTEARAIDARSLDVLYIGAMVEAETTIERETDDFALARFAAHAACAINTGESASIDQVNSLIEKSLHWRLYSAAPGQFQLPLPFVVIKEMMAESFPIAQVKEKSCIGENSN